MPMEIKLEMTEIQTQQKSVLLILTFPSYFKKDDQYFSFCPIPCNPAK